MINDTLINKRKEKEKIAKKGTSVPSLNAYVEFDLGGKAYTQEMKDKLQELANHFDVYQVTVLNAAPVREIKDRQALEAHQGVIQTNIENIPALCELLDKKTTGTEAIAIDCQQGFNVESCRKLIELSKRSDIRLIRLVNLPELILPPAGLSVLERVEFLQALNKIESKEAVTIDFNQCLFQNNEEMNQVYHSFPILKGDILKLQKAPLHVIEFFLKKNQHFKQIDFSGSEVLTVQVLESFQTQGLLNNFKKIDLQNCSKLNTDIIKPLSKLSHLVRVKISDDLPLGKITPEQLPTFDNPMMIREFFCQCAALRSHASSHYTGPQEYAILFQLPLAKAKCNTFPYNRKYTSLDPETAFYLLIQDSYRLMPKNRYISKINLDFVGSVTDQNLLPFLSCFTRNEIEKVSLVGCDITLDAFKTLDGQIDTATLKRIKKLDLRGTKVKDEQVILLLKAVPELKIEGFRLCLPSNDPDEFTDEKRLATFNTTNSAETFINNIAQDPNSFAGLSAVYLFPPNEDGTLQKYESPHFIPGSQSCIFVVTDLRDVEKYIVDPSYHEEPKIQELFKVTPENALEKLKEAIETQNKSLIRICRSVLELFAKDHLEQNEESLKAFSPISEELADFTVIANDGLFKIHKHLFANQSRKWAQTFAFGGEGYIADQQPLEADPTMNNIVELYGCIVNYFYKGNIGTKLTPALAADLLWLTQLYDLNELQNDLFEHLWNKVLLNPLEDSTYFQQVIALFIITNNFILSPNIVRKCGIIIRDKGQNPEQILIKWDEQTQRSSGPKTQPSWDALCVFGKEILGVPQQTRIRHRSSQNETDEEYALRLERELNG